MAASLGLTAEEGATLLPLKPRQCVVIVPGTFLTVTGGQVWLDNLYLMLHHTVTTPVSTFLLAEAEGRVDLPEQAELHVFVTNATLHNQHRGSAAGVWMTVGRLLLQGALWNSALPSCRSSCLHCTCRWKQARKS